MEYLQTFLQTVGALSMVAASLPLGNQGAIAKLVQTLAFNIGHAKNQ
jgi:hypothetical protein